MHPDTVADMAGSVVHHGSANDRVYLMKLAAGNPAETVQDLESLALARGYSKIIAKVPDTVRDCFETAGYRTEAEIQTARKKASEEAPGAIADRFSFRVPTPNDAEAMAELYRQVFATYPFPIHDPAYLRRTMAENVAYFGIWDGGRLVALSSAEMCTASRSAEMTDFATLPEYRGSGLASFLLQKMEEEMPERGVRTAYTIARAVSFGMNITFARQGYRFGGTLTNNTNISGDLESMNVWYKPLE
ncbi:MAG: putative beta-lysine N-acetyltransferase [Desulfuromonadales bacterium]